MLFNLFLAILVVTGLLFLFFSSLNYLTNHGKETTVPNLQGKKMKEALQILGNKGFRIKIDSTYQSYKDPLEVLFQEPEAGATVKEGRTIFITVNRKTPPSIQMPNLVNTSFRNALLTMQSYRLVMGDTTYRPDVAAGAVLEQWVNGKQVAPGTLVPFGSRVDLVIGEGLSDMQDVPNLIGMTWGEAKTIIQNLNLTPNAVWEGTITDSMNAIVFMQQPEALNELDFKNSILSGDLIDLRITQSPSAELIQKNQPGSQKLLGENEAVKDSNEIDPVNTLVPTSKDTLPKRRTVPGMNAPDNRKEKDNLVPKSKDAKNLNDKNVKDLKAQGANKLKDNKSKENLVSEKPYQKPKPKPTKPKESGVKGSEDNIKNEFE